MPWWGMMLMRLAMSALGAYLASTGNVGTGVGIVGASMAMPSAKVVKTD